jgi:MoaA/NifB/PqqE/SkfB family radical SAM enzyme
MKPSPDHDATCREHWPGVPGNALRPLTDAPFQPKASRAEMPPIGFVMTTERCHLSCVMCHFNGPKAKRIGETTIEPDLVVKLLERRPRGEPIWFVATGEFFSDPNALDHIRAARDRGLLPRVITHGQHLVPEFIEKVLEAGVTELLISVDSIDARQYAKIRRGGRLDVILDACRYLQGKKSAYPHLKVGISVVCLGKNQPGRSEVMAFWKPRVDYVQFVSEYYDVFRMRRLFFVPKQRTDCHVQLIPLPSGRVAPCCAIAIYSHDHDVSWLPHLADCTAEEAYRTLCDMYEDSTSPLSKLCTTCDWWVQFHTDETGRTPCWQKVTFDEQPSGGIAGEIPPRSFA